MREKGKGAGQAFVYRGAPLRPFVGEPGAQNRPGPFSGPGRGCHWLIFYQITAALLCLILYNNRSALFPEIIAVGQGVFSPPWFPGGAGYDPTPQKKTQTLKPPPAKQLANWRELGYNKGWRSNAVVWEPLSPVQGRGVLVTPRVLPYVCLALILHHISPGCKPLSGLFFIFSCRASGLTGSEICHIMEPTEKMARAEETGRFSYFLRKEGGACQWHAIPHDRADRRDGLCL